jgi:hypothetical protein
MKKQQQYASVDSLMVYTIMLLTNQENNLELLWCNDLILTPLLVLRRPNCEQKLAWCVEVDLPERNVGFWTNLSRSL